MHVRDHRGTSVAATPDDGVEVVDLEPHRHAVAERKVGVGHAAVVVRDIKSVQLEHHRGVDEQLLVFLAAVAARVIYYSLVPASVALHVGNAEQRLQADWHRSSLPEP